jgi:ADP-ribosylglycohydrolase
LAVCLARTGACKERIRDTIGQRFGYDLSRSVNAIRPSYGFDISCQGTVPEAIIAFLDSESYVDAVRNAVSLGGDSDTLACIAGGIAEAFYGGVPTDIRQRIQLLLPCDLWEMTVAFRARCGKA